MRIFQKLSSDLSEHDDAENNLEVLMGFLHADIMPAESVLFLLNKLVFVPMRKNLKSWLQNQHDDLSFSKKETKKNSISAVLCWYNTLRNVFFANEKLLLEHDDLQQQLSFLLATILFYIIDKRSLVKRSRNYVLLDDDDDVGGPLLRYKKMPKKFNSWLAGSGSGLLGSSNG